MATTSKKTTTKSSASKKPAAKSAAATKKSTVKRAVAKKPVTVKRAAQAAKKGHFQSFKVANDPAEFSSMRITRQTIYWIILVSFIIFAQLWIIKLQIDVATLIDAQQAQLQNF